MSASLVGSEMCIRDRRSTEVGGCVGRGVDGRPTGVGCSRSLVAVAPPVSYTHLTLPTICSV
eukprot:10710665-Alexandrium_andersonii.AAC.1